MAVYDADVPGDDRPDSSRRPGTDDQVVDATRRTHLANERTFLAWLRTGLTAFAVAIGVGQIVPAYTGEGDLAYGIVGVGFALLGIAVVAFGLARVLAVGEALRVGRYRPAGTSALAAICAAAVLLGAAVVVLLVVFG
jgi:putative membrane protein